MTPAAPTADAPMAPIPILYDGKPATIVDWQEHCDEGRYATYAVVRTADGSVTAPRWPSPRIGIAPVVP